MYFHNHHNDKVFTQPLSMNSNKSCSQLPEELIIEILLRLPVRSLHQFKCISKLWKTLISDPQFVKRHLQISTANPSLTHQRLYFSQLKKPDKIVYYPLKPLFENLLPPVSFSSIMEKQYSIIGSYNGLLCLYNVYERCVMLRNPSIMFESKKSPPVSLDWTIQHHGFGYDQVNNKYKVLLAMPLEE
ncbi:F-box/kelch-repeat protein At3g23880-like [Vicia villosa]|uniref:F-box/kelch-repeat protein At3g23880-like n=1 Tax=Vicia villosa TaxID=3911 RepID=UPI00273C8EAB|nr:F-box/kelch-repeat protein At3g23880-like [Vicia villosa]